MFEWEMLEYGTKIPGVIELYASVNLLVLIFIIIVVIYFDKETR